MLAEADRPETPEHAEGRPNPLDALVVDPTGRPPMCGEAEFDSFLEAWVADCAPKLFAVVQEYGERVDAKIAGWGIASDDGADVLGTDGGVHIGLSSADAALRFFRFGSWITPRLVWFNPDAVTRVADEDW